MQKSFSKSKINGKILLMQNDLMSKLANLESIPKNTTDQLGFASRNYSQFDSLTNLIQKAKDATIGQKDKINAARRMSTNNQISSKKRISNNQQQSGTFLTGVGLSIEPQQKQIQEKQNQQTKQIYRNYYSNPHVYQQQDPDELLKQMIKKNGQDDLAQLRRMIKQTDLSLKDYGRQLQKTRKDVLGMADKFHDIDYNIMDKITRFNEKKYQF